MSKLDKQIDDAVKKAKAKKPIEQLQPEAVKQKIVRVHPMGLLGLLMEGNKVHVKKGIVAGTRYVGGGYDAATNTFFIHVASDQFEETKIGDRLPTLEIELEDLTTPGEPNVR